MNKASEAPPPPFSLCDAEQIVRRLAPALREHGEWIQRVHAILVCRMQPEPGDVTPDGHLRSGLGQWFEQEPNEFIRGQPEYAKASAYHREVHELARATVPGGQRRQPRSRSRTTTASPAPSTASTTASRRWSRSCGICFASPTR